MNTFERNARVQSALGIRSVHFVCYRLGRAHWRVTTNDGVEFTITTHNFGTESTVLRLAAEKLAKMGRAVEYPEGA